MNFRTEWMQAEWTKEARNLIEGLNLFPEDSKIILIVRHSYRNSIQTLSDMAGIRLTLLGHEIAEIFGKELPKKKSIRVFHSPIFRCKETAEDILEGVKYVSGKGSMEESLNELYDIGVKPEFFFNEITKYPEMLFLYRWIAGLYPSEKITPFDKYCQNSGQEIWEKNIDAPKGSIDVHVSHDLIILTYRIGWFGLSPNEKWPSFLGGFAFAINKDEIVLLDRGKLVTVEIPYWWNLQYINKSQPSNYV